MRTRILLGAVAAAVAVPCSASHAASGCGSSLPVAPAGLPAPVVFRTACGSYRAGVDGSVARTRPVRPPWRSASLPFRIGVRDDHVVVTAHGRLVWRSTRAFRVDTSELDSVAFGGRAVAFSFMHGPLWVARFGRREHAVGWSEGALVWTSRGDLLTLQRRHGKWRIAARDRNGLQPHVIGPTRNFLVDDATRAVLYVTATGSLVRTDGRSTKPLANLESLGFDPRATLQVVQRDMISISSSERLAVLRADGSVFAAMDYPADPDGLKHGWAQFAVADDRVAVAVELEPPKGGVAGEDVYVLREGATQGRLLARLQAEWFACGWMGTMVWHGDWLLYSDTVVDVLAIDTSSGRQIDLSKTARQLPGVQLDGNSGEYVGLDFAVWG